MPYSTKQLSIVIAAYQRVVQVAHSDAAVEAIRGAGQTVLAFCGFSGAGYEDPAAVELIVLEHLEAFPPQSTTICAGATADGIGMVYPIARRKGYRTIGIVSSLAQAEGVAMSDDVEVVYVVKDDTWGGRQGSRLSPTSEVMVGACDKLIGIGGGAIARDELEEVRRRGKPFAFAPADMNHALAKEKARKAGDAPPTDFRGEAYALFHYY